MSGGGGFVGAFDAVLVVAGAFHGSRGGAVAAGRDQKGRDGGEVTGAGFSLMARSVARIPGVSAIENPQKHAGSCVAAHRDTPGLWLMLRGIGHRLSCMNSHR